MSVLEHFIEIIQLERLRGLKEEKALTELQKIAQHLWHIGQFILQLKPLEEKLAKKQNHPVDIISVLNDRETYPDKLLESLSQFTEFGFTRQDSDLLLELRNKGYSRAVFSLPELEIDMKETIHSLKTIQNYLEQLDRKYHALQKHHELEQQEQLLSQFSQHGTALKVQEKQTNKPYTLNSTTDSELNQAIELIHTYSTKIERARTEIATELQHIHLVMEYSSTVMDMLFHPKGKFLTLQELQEILKQFNKKELLQHSTDNVSILTTILEKEKEVVELMNRQRPHLTTWFESRKQELNISAKDQLHKEQHITEVLDLLSKQEHLLTNAMRDNLDISTDPTYLEYAKELEKHETELFEVLTPKEIERYLALKPQRPLQERLAA